MASLSPGKNWSLSCKWLHSVSIGVPARSTGSSESRCSLVWKRGRRVGEVERQTAVDAWKSSGEEGERTAEGSRKERREGGESEWVGKGSRSNMWRGKCYVVLRYSLRMKEGQKSITSCTNP